MVNYNCIRCGYTTKDKTKMKTHFNRKTVCKPLLNDINIDVYKKDILNGKIINLKVVTQNDSKKTQKDSKRTQRDSKMTQNDSKKLKNNSKIVNICKYCEKSFSRKNNLNRHYKTCKEKIRDDKCKKNMMELVDKLNDQLYEQREQIKEQNNQIKELIKKVGITQNIQNIQNNIKILAYKNTDTSHLTDKDYIYCLNRSNMCIPHLIKKIHFNSQKPENHNVYISNIKNKYIMVYDGNKWNLHNQDETIEELIDINEFVLEQKLEEWVENGKDYPEIMRKFKRYLEKKEKDDVLNKIKNEIQLVLYNNNKVISNNDNLRD
jgi:hypothetical protein